MRFEWSVAEGIARVITAFVILSVAGSAQTGSLPERGIVVEDVAKSSEGEKAGLRPGDVLLSWSRGEAHGEIHTPFDLAEAEAEAARAAAVAPQASRTIVKSGPPGARSVEHE